MSDSFIKLLTLLKNTNLVHLGIDRGSRDHLQCFPLFFNHGFLFLNKILGDSAVHKTNMREIGLLEVKSEEADIELCPLDLCSEEASGSLHDHLKTIWGGVIY